MYHDIRSENSWFASLHYLPDRPVVQKTINCEKFRFSNWSTFQNYWFDVFQQRLNGKFSFCHKTFDWKVVDFILFTTILIVSYLQKIANSSFSVTTDLVSSIKVAVKSFEFKQECSDDN